MTITITDRELATVLAALRLWQDYIELHRFSHNCGKFAGHFDDHDPLSTEQIDALCERINDPGNAAASDAYLDQPPDPPWTTSDNLPHNI